MNSGTRGLPLSGVKVIDASSYMSGPYAAMMLADLGAEVIKVESPKGDPCRRIGRRINGIGTLFANLNRGKRSVVLDLKNDEDFQLMLTLLGEADVFLENWRPGVSERMGLSQERLSELNPGLIHLSITGYGPSGPWAQRGSFDGAAQAVGGMVWLNAHDGVPEVSRTFVADKGAATFAVQAVLAALVARGRDGVGGLVETNMLDSQCYYNFPDMFEARTLWSDAEAVDPNELPSKYFVVLTSDGALVVSPTTRDQVRRTCEAVGHPEWHEEFLSYRDSRYLTPVLMSRVDAATRTGTSAEWIAKFLEYDVPVAPALDLDGHLACEQVTHNHSYVRASDANLGEFRVARYPARFWQQERTPIDERYTVPGLDCDGAEIRASARSKR